jgi:phage gp16-like protein
MIWKGSKSVGFGVKGKYVIAWYCPKGNNPKDDAVAYTKNVQDVCIVDAKDKYNRCYNNMALKYHNSQRALHKKTSLLKLDVAIAKKIQAEMEKKGFKGSITDKGSYASCGELVYEEKISTKLKELEFKNTASMAWYAGEPKYDYSKGEPKSPKDKDAKAASDKFTQMVWKGTAKVGFGIKGKWVIAWYCDKGSTGNNADFKQNVGEKCEKDGVNTCYNEIALKAHNVKRKEHEAKDLVYDKDMAKAL